MERSQTVSRLLLSAGLCGSCRHAGVKTSARSVFLLCRLSDSDSWFPRYPRLPVLECPGYERRAAEERLEAEDASSGPGC